MDRLGDYLLGPNDTPENGIYTGDARDLAEAIPDESVDLIFTDPVYDHIDDYRWLAGTAARTLKPDSAMLVWSNGKWHKQHTDWLESFRLCYRYTFVNIMIRAVAPMNGRIISKANRVLWFDKSQSSRMIGYLADGGATTVSSKYYRRGWSWSKSPKYTEMALEAFIQPRMIVVDPFVGQGTTPLVCSVWGYKWLAFEIEPDTAEMARKRVRNTQPPLFVPQPQQAALFE